MFGQSARNTVAAWKSAHGLALAEAHEAQPGHGDENDDLLLVPGWRRVPDAKACVSIGPSETGGTQFIVNNCNHKVEVQWCYVDKPGDFRQCDPGPPGLDFMDDVGHRATKKGAGVPDYYPASEHLEAKPRGNRVYGQDHSPLLELGRIRYIACGYDHIKDATRYEMEWDAHTGRFRCLAYFSPDGSEVPSEADAQ